MVVLLGYKSFYVASTGKSKNFNSYSHGVVDTLNLAYDYDSVMHYHNTAFSVNLADTIQVRNPQEWYMLNSRHVFVLLNHISLHFLCF